MIEHTENLRVFDVMLQNGNWNTGPTKVTVVAKSFLQASAAAVELANQMRDEVMKSEWVPKPPYPVEPFAPVHIIEMKIVRSGVAVFRPAEFKTV